VVAPEITQASEILVAGEWRATGASYQVRSPYDGRVVADVARAGHDEIEAAVAAAVPAFEATRRLPAHERQRVLAHVSRRIGEERETLARTLTLETGKPIRDSRVEVDRAVMTFAVAGEEAKRVGAEVVPMDWAPAGEGRVALNRRFPIGPVIGISPWNYPLNLVAHKVAPAIASGNPIVIKPASQTPTSALQIGRFVTEAGWPEGALSVLPSSAVDFEPFVSDPRVRKVTFTGSMDVGWHLKQVAWRQRITLEMGGNAGVIVHEDADLEHAVSRVVAGGFGFSGQSCISVQRVYVHRPIWQRFLDAVLPLTQALRCGDPLLETTDIGPMITEEAAVRTETWLEEALAGGANALVRGRREGTIVRPTILVEARPEMNVCSREVFAPLINVFPYDEFPQALAAVNDSVYGLQAGVFTRDVRRIFEAYETLEVGGLMVNEVPSWRIDNMPYGGVKESGWGREGLRYAIEEMTETRLLVMALR
jgi:acyl-CoA reductase-like NAD-dependent aldehyde dehydrogenase